MALRIFDALLPYFGNKRKLCPVIFGHIAKYLPRDKWQKSVFVDAFLGSGAVGLYAKAQGFRVICNDIAERSYIAGRALIDNNYLRINTHSYKDIKNQHPIYTINEREKEKIGIFQGMADRDRENLKEKGIL